MSMTYYAVTDDPNELAHFGIKGMKWGVRHDRPRHSGSRSRRPRSAAYKKASGKLSKVMRSGIKKVEADWRAYNSPAAKYERQTNRALAKARKGKLKYGKLSDDQVRRITERLTMEKQARDLSSREQTFGSRLGKAITEGIITGVGSGVGRIVSEKISRGSTLKTDRLKAEQQQEFEKAKERRNRRNVDKIARDKDKRDFEQKKRSDKYEHEREQQYQLERARNAYLYGAGYTDDGKMTGNSLSTYYEQRNARRKTLQQENKEAIRAAAKKAIDEYHATQRVARAEVRRHNAEQRANERAMAIENRHALRRADEELKRETALKRFNDKYDRKLEQQAKREEQRTKRLMSGEDRARIDYHNTSNRRKKKGKN